MGYWEREAAAYIWRNAQNPDQFINFQEVTRDVISSNQYISEYLSSQTYRKIDHANAMTCQ